ncbi:MULTISPECIES: transglycosylase family protein [Streptomyces]|uniref:Resuscitation-promoting factor RpfA n=1 Tax=Streptomyces chartreusis NRRL 3882 TaxID=1079985 RepID=A0A2N9BD73_STRCX|nr:MULTISPECIES: transglycosylase family protein [Streptomyces]MYS89724.1 LysM peptidoglycan-binding domain-containing protein [Streptomyces sp. SID5464]SOR81318.1 Resuscitation-promoting factor RpfA precursor [Streptomyces chartreusis NRRL 3882]
MLSGNGRHRRPRQAPALLVAAGVTGSAIAIPLLGASGASAADGTTWDRVADCETGGAWSQNSGNGYFGGLALSQEDWENHGGLDYAPSADLASRSQQIAVAERILADQGVGAWRTCGLLSGLQQDKDSGTSDSSSSSDSSAPTDSPGLLDSSESSESSGSSSSSSSPSSSSPSPSSSPDGQSTSEGDTAKSDKSSDSADSSTRDQSQDQESGSSPSTAAESDEPDKSRQGDGSSALSGTGTDSASGRHRGPSADEDTGAEDGRTSGAAGRHASRGGEASREATDGSYTVRPGDSLWSIANSLDLSGGWHALYAGNETAVGADPNLIRPGQKLTVRVEADDE